MFFRMVSLMLAAGGIIVCLVIYALIKGYDARVTLIGAGILMACIGGGADVSFECFRQEHDEQRSDPGSVLCHGVCDGRPLHRL